MSKEITISNNILEVKISTFGAEIISVKNNGQDLIWEGDPNVWGFHAPLLFPICGGVKDDKYFYQGKEYTLPKHGFTRKTEFEFEGSTENSATFLLKSNDETRKMYPFDFELRVIYTIVKNELSVKYDVKNLTDGDMYFSIGSHEGYACPNGIEEYSVIFEKEEDFESNILVGNSLSYDTNTVLKNSRELPLKYDYFAVDALVFLNLKSRKLTLKNNVTGKEIGLDFEEFPYFLIWTKPGAKYICLEPWCGIPDFLDSDYDFTNKKGIIKLQKGETTTREHKILF